MCALCESINRHARIMYAIYQTLHNMRLNYNFHSTGEELKEEEEKKEEEKEEVEEQKEEKEKKDEGDEEDEREEEEKEDCMHMISHAHSRCPEHSTWYGITKQIMSHCTHVSCL